MKTLNSLLSLVGTAIMLTSVGFYSFGKLDVATYLILLGIYAKISSRDPN